MPNLNVAFKNENDMTVVTIGKEKFMISNYMLTKFIEESNSYGELTEKLIEYNKVPHGKL